MDASTHQQVRDLLTGESGQFLINNIFDLALDTPPRDGYQALTELEQLGWVKEQKVTLAGRLVFDPIREYIFWLERDKALPYENDSPLLNRTSFADKRVLEIGSGGGCNLLSLSGIPSFLAGIDPVEEYLEMTPILAQLAGVPTPVTRQGYAENIPFDADSFDIVICYGSHQYMALDRAVGDMARVLGKGGRAIIVGSTLGRFLKHSIQKQSANINPGLIKYDGIAVLNSISFQLLKKRIIVGGALSTATPIYPSTQFMKKLFLQAGFRWDQENFKEFTSGEVVMSGLID